MINAAVCTDHVKFDDFFCLRWSLRFADSGQIYIYIKTSVSFNSKSDDNVQISLTLLGFIWCYRKGS